MITVEEAREKLWGGLMDFEDSFKDDIDLLILAVQAEMPCYRDGGPMCSCWIGATFIIEQCGAPCYHCGKPLEFCPSCTARRKLAEMEVPA